MKEFDDKELAEDTMRLTEEKYRLVVDNAKEAIFVAQDGMLKFLNPKTVELVGYPRGELTSRPFSEFIHPEDRELVLERHLRRLRGEEFPGIYSFRVVDNEGNIKWVEINAVLIFWDGRPATLNFLNDISRRKLAEDYVHSLSQELIRAQETERQRLSMTLHDNLAQNLSALKVGLDTLFDDKPDIDAPRREKICELSRLVQMTISAVREIAYDLRPATLDQLGLVQTAFQCCEDFSGRSGIQVDFSSAGLNDVRLDFDTEIALYRLIQEALTNIKRHADATHVVIRLLAAFPHIILRIQDNGRGFDVQDRLDAALNERRMGIRSMEERVALLRGKMKIESRPAQGTKILVEVPFTRKNSG
jgi:PAS domain S-box-containing protein